MIGNAVRVMRIATGEETDDVKKPQAKRDEVAIWGQISERWSRMGSGDFPPVPPAASPRWLDAYLCR